MGTGAPLNECCEKCGQHVSTTLEAQVARMRALGVRRWGDVELSATPYAPPAPETKPDLRSEAERVLASRRDRYRRELGFVPSDDALAALP